MSVPRKVPLAGGYGLAGWMALTRGSTPLNGMDGKTRPWTLADVATHVTRDDCWIVLRGRVYNVTEYLAYHPGGESELMRGAGIDATSLFDGIHPWVNLDSLLGPCYVGPLVDRPAGQDAPAGTATRATPVASSSSLAVPGAAAASGPPRTLQGSAPSWRRMTVVVFDRVNHDSVYVQLRPEADGDAPLPKLPVGWHLQLRLRDKDGYDIVRPYTPIVARTRDANRVEFQIKLYPNGQFTRLLAALSAGSALDMRGPTGHVTFDLASSDPVLLLAGGSGITPMVQILRGLGVLGGDDAGDTQQPAATRPAVALVYGNRTTQDIWFRSEFEAARDAGRLALRLVLSQADAEWTGPRGHVSAELVTECVASWPAGAAARARSYICGPPAFVATCQMLLKGLGVPTAAVF